MDNTPGSLPPVPPVTTPVSQGTSNRNKIIIIVLAVVAVLCLVACLVGLLVFRSLGQRVSQSVSEDPAAVEEQAGDVAEFDLPAGFTPENSLSLMGMDVAIYSNAGTDAGLVLLQMPMQMPLTDQTLDQLGNQMQTQTGRNLENVKVIDDYEKTIRGQPGRVIIYEGTSDGETYRQMMAVFQGKRGTAMLTAFGPASTWDQATYDAMIESIR